MRNTTCTFPECVNSPRSRGLCVGHVSQLRRGQNLRPLQMYSKGSVEDRLETYSVKGEGCWLWSGTILDTGYAAISVSKKRILAHRAAYELAYGEIPSGYVIDHKCRTRACVNPEHLQAVTRQQNNENRSNEGRGATGVRGVSYESARGKFAAYAIFHNKKHNAGRHDSIEDAAKAARELRLRLHANNLADRV